MSPSLDEVLERASGLGQVSGIAVADVVEQLAASARTGGQLSQLGEVSLAFELSHCLDILMSLDHTTHVENALVERDVPVIVGGLPRTGTTLLHYLLAECEGTRSLLAWQATDPVAASGSYAAECDAKSWSQVRFKLLSAIAPSVPAQHPMGAERLEECTPLLMQTLHCLQFAIMVPAPAYVAMLADADLTPAYSLWAKQLQLIGRNMPGRWVLKSPLHFLDYRALTAAAPGAQIIQVRRDVVSWMESFLRFTAAVREPFTREVAVSRLFAGVDSAMEDTSCRGATALRTARGPSNSHGLR